VREAHSVAQAHKWYVLLSFVIWWY